MLEEDGMPAAAERLSYLEGQVNEHSNNFVEFRESIRHLEQRMDTGFAAMERRFTWVVGLQVTTLVAVVGALLARG
jgi:hypothetical protein